MQNEFSSLYLVPGSIKRPLNEFKKSDLFEAVIWKYKPDFTKLKVRQLFADKIETMAWAIVGLSDSEDVGILHVYHSFGKDSEKVQAYVKFLASLWGEEGMTESNCVHGFIKSGHIPNTDSNSSSGRRYLKYSGYDVWIDYKHGVVFSFSRVFMKKRLKQHIEKIVSGEISDLSF